MTDEPSPPSGEPASGLTGPQRVALGAMVLTAVGVGSLGLWSSTWPAPVPAVPYVADIGGLPTDRPEKTDADIPLPKGVPAPGRGYLDGRADAPIFVQVWSGLQCDICGRFEREATDPLREASDAGNITVEYGFGAFVGPGSEIAANALGCAADQGMFRDFLDLSEDRMPTNDSALEQGFTGKDMLAWGKEIGVPDFPEYKNCVRNGTYLPYVETVMRTMIDADVNHVPALVIDGTNVFGSRMSYRQFLSSIGVAPEEYIPDGKEDTDLWEACGGTSRSLAIKDANPTAEPSETTPDTPAR